MFNDHGERIITINREKALEQVKKNRETHEAEFSRILTGYKRKLAKNFMNEFKRLKKTRKFGEFKPNIDMSPPSHHLKEYDSFIKILEWSLEEDIELTVKEFDNYICDDWSWKGSWMFTYGAYGPTGATGPVGCTSPTGPTGIDSQGVDGIIEPGDETDEWIDELVFDEAE